MPKMKSNKGAQKRLKFTGGSKIKRAGAYRRHILTNMSRKRKRDLRGVLYVHPSDRKEVLRLLPNG